MRLVLTLLRFEEMYNQHDTANVRTDFLRYKPGYDGGFAGTKYVLHLVLLNSLSVPSYKWSKQIHFDLRLFRFLMANCLRTAD